MTYAFNKLLVHTHGNTRADLCFHIFSTSRLVHQHMTDFSIQMELWLTRHYWRYACLREIGSILQAEKCLDRIRPGFFKGPYKKWKGSNTTVDGWKESCTIMTELLDKIGNVNKSIVKDILLMVWKKSQTTTWDV